MLTNFNCKDDKKSVLISDSGEKIESVVYTDPIFAKKMINYFSAQFQETDTFLDPCRGKGAFFDNLPENKDWCEIMENKDFFHYQQKTNWIIGNPPWRGRIYAPFTNHALQIGDNVIWLVKLFGGIGTLRRLRDARTNHHAIKEIIIVDWKDANFSYLDGTKKAPEGFVLSVIHWQKNYKEGTKWTYWI